MENQNMELQNTETKKGFSAKDFWLGAVVGLLCTALVMLICAGLYLTLGGGSNTPGVAQNNDTLESSLTGISDYYDTDSIVSEETLQKLDDIAALFQIYSIYDIDNEKLERGVIDGLVAGSGDRYAEYYTVEELNDLFSDYEGTFYGIGALLFMSENNLPTISSVYADSPAERAGLMADDIITAVDGTDVEGMTLDEVVKMIRGDKGTDVVITVYRTSAGDYLDLTATRDEIKVTTVTYEMQTDEIGYIQIQTFESVTPEQFGKALSDLKEKNMKALIIDLRSNTGGLLDAVVDIGQQILPKGLVVYTEDVFGNREEFTCDGKNQLDIPIVILTNGYTASASEILTGALKAYDMAITMGTKTYGKGVVQTFATFEDGSGMKLTTEKYYTPDGICIDGEGFKPDIEVTFDSDAYYNSDEPFDNQLDAAIQYLEDELK
jgi:carboxyl-terminal processing protease